MGKQFQISLPDEIAVEIAAAVNRGEYNSEEEIISQAIEDWHGRRLEDGFPLDHLRALVEEGLASGPGRELNIEELIAEARAERERR